MSDITLVGIQRIAQPGGFPASSRSMTGQAAHISVTGRHVSQSTKAKQFILGPFDQV